MSNKPDAQIEYKRGKAITINRNSMGSTSGTRRNPPSGLKINMQEFSVGVNSPQFIADFLVSHIKPTLEPFTKKLGDLNIAGRLYRLFPSNERLDLLDYAKQSQLSVIESLNNELPSWFDSGAYLSRLQACLETYMNSHNELRSAVNDVSKVELDDVESVKVFRNAISLLGDRMPEWYRSFENYNANLILISDIPVDYFLITKSAELTQASSFNIVAKSLGKLGTSLNIARGFVKFSQNAENFKTEVSSLVAAGRLLSDSLSRVNLYLDASNSDKLEDMFKLSPYLQKRINQVKFDKLLSDLEISLAGLNDELILRQGFAHEHGNVSEYAAEFQNDLANVILA